jgi:hypothetical protein
MKRLQVRRSRDGKWEAGPEGAPALVVFESEDEVEAFVKSIAALDPGAAIDLTKGLSEQPMKRPKRATA